MMVSARGLVSLVTLVAVPLLVAAGAAQAKPGPRPPVPELARVIGATEVVRRTAPEGFIDDVIAADEQRLAYVVARTGTAAELHVYSHATQQEQVADLSPITLHPVSLALLGSRVFVVGKTEDGRHTAGAIELAARGKAPAGAVVYTLGPASRITLITRDGKPRVAVHRMTPTTTGTRHEVELVAVETGRRVAAPRPFELDGSDQHAKLELRVNHWSEGMSRAHGIKAGEWDRKENQRRPDLEATYDLVSGKLVERTKIEDLFEQRRRYQTLATHGATGAPLDFLAMAWDHSGLQVWRAGKPRAVELDQPLTSYDPKSMQGVVRADGAAWIALKVDPVNAEAVARKKADPEYLDVFRVGAEGKASRTARVLARGVRHWFGAVGERFWLIERTPGFERGGRSVTLYQLP